MQLSHLKKYFDLWPKKDKWSKTEQGFKKIFNECQLLPLVIPIS